MPRRIVCTAIVALLPALAAAEPVRFDVEVMAVLSRAGCNQGACHGNLNGKGGFKLSLRGQDAEFDLAAVTRDQLGRRANPHNPDASLFLLKPTGQVLHEGGGATLRGLGRRRDRGAADRPGSGRDHAQAAHGGAAGRGGMGL